MSSSPCAEFGNGGAIPASCLSGPFLVSRFCCVPYCPANSHLAALDMTAEGVIEQRVLMSSRQRETEVPAVPVHMDVGASFLFEVTQPGPRRAHKALPMLPKPPKRRSRYGQEI